MTPWQLYGIWSAADAWKGQWLDYTPIVNLEGGGTNNEVRWKDLGTGSVVGNTTNGSSSSTGCNSHSQGCVVSTNKNPNKLWWYDYTSPAPSNYLDFRNIMAHEFGHFSGLKDAY